MNIGLKIGLVLSCCFLWEAQTFSQVKIRFGETFKQEEIQVGFREQSYKTKLDESGAGIINVSDTLASGYAVLYGPRSVCSFYLMPGQRQDIIQLPGEEIKFAGAAEAVNMYLNSPFWNNLNITYGESEEKFLKKWELLPDRLWAHLDSLPLPSDFKNLERKRLYYVACNLLLSYPLRHTRLLHLKSYSPGEGYCQKISEIMQEDSSAKELWEYRQFFRDAVQLLGEKEKSETGKLQDKLRYELNYIRGNIRDEELAAYLTDACMSGYIRYFGTEGVEEFLPFYDEKVKDGKRKTAFFQSYNQYSRLEQGKSAPDFSLLDIQGNRLNLSDWLGYYVYIDVWATWCGPCCRELPAFHKLKEQFKDRPVRFISISIDMDEAAWRDKIEKDGWTGIQLHVNKGDTFREDYKISLIPRFILIDREGKIVDANMSRPSEVKTVKMLSSLLSVLENGNIMEQ